MSIPLDDGRQGRTRSPMGPRSSREPEKTRTRAMIAITTAEERDQAQEAEDDDEGGRRRRGRARPTVCPAVVGARVPGWVVEQVDARFPVLERRPPVVRHGDLRPKEVCIEPSSVPGPTRRARLTRCDERPGRLS